MRRVVQLCSVLPILLVGAAPAPVALPAAQAAELEIRVTAPDGAPNTLVRVAAVSADAGGELQVFERRAPFSWRVPEGKVNVIAQPVGRTTHITVEMRRPDLTGPDGSSFQLASGTGRTIVMHNSLFGSGYGVVVLP